MTIERGQTIGLDTLAYGRSSCLTWIYIAGRCDWYWICIKGHLFCQISCSDVLRAIFLLGWNVSECYMCPVKGKKETIKHIFQTFWVLLHKCKAIFFINRPPCVMWTFLFSFWKWELFQLWKQVLISLSHPCTSIQTLHPEKKITRKLYEIKYFWIVTGRKGGGGA